jgi:O-methyltransferase involved in polyketide biosynthesis
MKFLPRRGSEAISPTAHYTGYVWYRNGLSHPALATPEGHALHLALRPANRAAQTIGAPTLDGLLLARHRAIDQLLDQAILDGRVGQVIEIAAGLSPRGWDFSRRYGKQIKYIEADLPDMARRKRELLERAGLESRNHRVVELDALADTGPHSLAALAKTLDPKKGLAIVTEGLINYFDTPAVLGMWRRFAAALGRFPHGLYLSDLHLAEDAGLGVQTFARVLGLFVRGRVYLHFGSEAEAETALRDSGFATAQLRQPEPQADAAGVIDREGPRLVRVVSAVTG